MPRRASRACRLGPIEGKLERPAVSLRRGKGVAVKTFSLSGDTCRAGGRRIFFGGARIEGPDPLPSPPSYVRPWKNGTPENPSPALGGKTRIAFDIKNGVEFKEFFD